MSILNSEQGKSLLMNQLEHLQTMIRAIHSSNEALQGHEEYLIIHLINYAIQLSTFQIVINGSQLIPNSQPLFIDYSNVHIIGRGILENYFTIHYLYFEDMNDLEMQKCKQLIYSIHGLNNRQKLYIEVPPQTPEQNTKMIEEANFLQRYITDLQANSAFQTLSAGQQQHILDKKPSKMINITDLTKRPYFAGNSFYHLYKMYCNFAHTDFVSIMKLDTIFHNPENLSQFDHVLRSPISHTIFMNASLFTKLRNRFASLVDVYNSFPEDFQNENELWYRMSQ